MKCFQIVALALLLMNWWIPLLPLCSSSEQQQRCYTSNTAEGATGSASDFRRHLIGRFMRSVDGGLFGMFLDPSPWMLRGVSTFTSRQRLDIANYPRKNGRFHETPTAATHSADTGPNAQNNAGEMGPFDRGPTEVHGFHSTKMGVIGKVISHLRGMWCCFFGNTRCCVKYTV